ncbi:MAG: sugar phosphate isomerase/epimerase [Planctomycetia bacterium]|nr:sugar phosphate isomerase/epimerase [Planctomycetia bacterium]
MKMLKVASLCWFLLLGTLAWGQDMKVGLQLYSLRSIMKEDVEKGLKTAAEMGFQYVEGANSYGLSMEAYKALLDQYGLETPVAGGSFNDLTTDEGIAQLVSKAKILGAKYVNVAWIPHKAPFDEADARNAIAVFNTAGEKLAKEGITLLYHNHGYEFHPYGDGTLMDLIVQETNPQYVQFEMDILWTIFPGVDPVALLKKYPDRWKAMHLKDLKKGVTGNLSGGTSVENDVTLGTGQADYPSILKTAQEVGVLYYFIEDESPRFLEQIPQSLKYLEKVELIIDN